MVDQPKKKIIACAAVLEEMLPLLPRDMSYRILDTGLHFRPTNLQKALQEAIDQSAGDASILILGYGLCSKGAVGLKAPVATTLVIPKIHDCIAIFLGSHESYLRELNKEKGTYFLTRGIIETGDTPLHEHRRAVERFGKKAADRVMNAMLCHYTRLLFVNARRNGIGKYRDHAKRTASQFGLRFEESKGSRSLMLKMIHGPWDEEFIIAKPGETITLDRFLK